MAKKKKRKKGKKSKKKNNKKKKNKNSSKKKSVLSPSTKRKIKAVIMFVVALIFIFSFFEQAGPAGKLFLKGLDFLIGNSRFAIPVLFIIAGIVFLVPKHRGKLLPVILGIFILILGTSGILAGIDIIDSNSMENFVWNQSKSGGWIGYLLSWPLLRYFGVFIANIIFGAINVAGLFILFQFLGKSILQGRKSASKKKKKMKKKVNPAVNKIKKITPKIKKVSSGGLQVNKFKQDGSSKEKKTANGKKGSSKGKYEFPPLHLLSKEKEDPSSGNIKKKSKTIKKTLGNFEIPVDMAEVNVGPTVTQYTLRPAEGIKLSKITTLSRNLALGLAAHPIRIEAPIPGRSLVGIEVPNEKRAKVRLYNLMNSSKFRDSSSPLLLCMGRGVTGEPVYSNLSRMPHLLVAGATGSGKTIFLNNLIMSLLYQNSPNDLNFILIDPKKVEFQSYNHFPHLLIPVITEVDTAINALQWLVEEMQRRFEIFSSVPTRNIETYNKKVKSAKKKLPYIVLVIDELADLMATKGREMEAGIVRLAQMARATGIHLIVATQRPSVEVITGLIKANITSRVSFQVASQVDSRTVLDMAGAETLLGRGDMLYISSQRGKPMRIQSAYVSENEIKRVTKFITKQKNKSHVPKNLKESIEKYLKKAKKKTSSFSVGEDVLYPQAKKLVIEAGKASSSMLQRRLRVGYARAARLLDMLHEQGIVGPSRGSKARKVLVDEFDESGNDYESEEEYEDKGEYDNFDESSDNSEEDDKEDDSIDNRE